MGVSGMFICSSRWITGIRWREPAKTILSLPCQLGLNDHPERSRKNPCAYPAGLAGFPCCFTRAKPTGEHGLRHSAVQGPPALYGPHFLAGHTPLRMKLHAVLPLGGRCCRVLLRRPLGMMHGLVRFVHAIRLYHDVHQFLLGVDVAFHAFPRQLCQR